MAKKTTFKNLDDNYEFDKEIGLGGCFGEFVNDQDHCCYNYDDSSDIEFNGNQASFTRTCSECNTTTRLIYYIKKNGVQYDTTPQGC